MRESVRNAIIALAEQNDGSVTPEAVVEEARSDTSPLHGEFEWDDTLAAEKFRVDQARRLLARVTVRVSHGLIKVRAPMFVHDPAAGTNPETGRAAQGYVTLARLRNDPDLAREAAIAEFGRAAAALKRARAVAQILGIEQDIDEISEALLGLRARFETESGTDTVSPS